jgi:hypothetical protein
MREGSPKPFPSPSSGGLLIRRPRAPQSRFSSPPIRPSALRCEERYLADRPSQRKDLADRLSQRKDLADLGRSTVSAEGRCGCGNTSMQQTKTK